MSYVDTNKGRSMSYVDDKAKDFIPFVQSNLYLKESFKNLFYGKTTLVSSDAI